MNFIDYQGIANFVSDMMVKASNNLQLLIAKSIVVPLSAIVLLYITWVAAKAMLGDGGGIRSLPWFIAKLLIVLTIISTSPQLLKHFTSLALDVQNGVLQMFAQNSVIKNYGQQASEFSDQFYDLAKQAKQIAIAKIEDINKGSHAITGIPLRIGNFLLEIAYAIVTYIYFIFGLLLGSLYFIFSLINNLTLMLTIILMPFAIACSLFKSTNGIFNKWLNIIVTTVLTSAFLTLVMAIILNITKFVNQYVAQHINKSDLSTALLIMFVSGGFLFLIGIVLIKMAKDLAAALTDVNFESVFTTATATLTSSVGGAAGAATGAGTMAVVGAGAKVAIAGAKHGAPLAGRAAGAAKKLFNR